MAEHLFANLSDFEDIADPIRDDLDAHIADTTNPHVVTKTQVGLGNVTDDAQLKIASNLADLANAATARGNLDVYSTSEVDTALDGKIDLVAAPVAGNLVQQTAGGELEDAGIAPSDLVSNLNDLDDVNAPTPADQAVLRWVDASGEWQAVLLGTLADLNQVDTAQIAANSVNNAKIAAGTIAADRLAFSVLRPDVAGQIAGLTEKVSPVDGDHLLIEDSEDANAKKRVQIGNIASAGLIYVKDTAQATTSVSSVDFTKPAEITTVERITVVFDQVALASPGEDVLAQIGDSGGLETSGYVSVSTGNATSTQGFIFNPGASGTEWLGSMTLNRVGGNTWVEDHSAGEAGGTPAVSSGGGRKELSAELDRIRITPTAGNFNNGQINVIWEGT